MRQAAAPLASRAKPVYLKTMTVQPIPRAIHVIGGGLAGGEGFYFRSRAVIFSAYRS